MSQMCAKFTTGLIILSLFRKTNRKQINPIHTANQAFDDILIIFHN